MSFSVRRIGGASVKEWTFLGSATGVAYVGTPLSLPVTAQAGDLIVVSGGTNASISMSGTTFGSAASCKYIICSGGETSYSISSGGGAVALMMFRPQGTASLVYGTTITNASSSTSTTISSAPSGPGIYIGAFNTVNNYPASFTSPTGVSSNYASGNGSASLGYKFISTGEVVGTATITNGSPYSTPKTFGIFHFT